MIPDPIHTTALELFEKGQYTECLGFIHSLSPRERVVPIRILEAVSLIETGSREDAEVCLRDLRITVPDSAEVCIYLGRILRERDDDEARAAFSEAVRLDPDNKDGLSWYADLLMEQDDYNAAIPVLIRLYSLFLEPRILCLLMQAYVKAGMPEKAVDMFICNNRPVCCRIEYLRALSDSGRDDEILSLVQADPHSPPDEFVFLVRSLVKTAPEVADPIILPRIKSSGSTLVSAEYVRLLLKQKRYREAVGVWSSYLSCEQETQLKTLICPALCNIGEFSRAGEIYDSVLFPNPPDAHVSDILELLKAYGDVIRSQYGSVDELMEKAGQVMHPSYAAFAGHCAKESGRHHEAQVYYQKAFRYDIVHGGLLYADFLAESGNNREWEKIMLYILKNTGKITDIEHVASSCIQDISSHIPLIRFLHEKLQKKLPLLSSKGKSIYCQAASLIATEELHNGRYSDGLTLCLDALEKVPPHDQKMAENLFSVLMACKTPGLPVRYTIHDQTRDNYPSGKPLAIPGLTPAEESVLTYIRRHRVCSELELRSVCGTKRVAGLMNRLMRKTMAGGWQVLMKEGVSESGEVYRYEGP
ncbi:MAG: hypothetical protein GXY48_02870 [Methanomicrobiales archaeon]|nr:hypothetical protein [Methanomicrobiales archaeon]